MSREDALDKAIAVVTSGKLPPQLPATPDLIVETAGKFHDFLTQPNEKPEPDPDPPQPDVTF